jgi:para-nitrobenzyl esterase
MNPNITYITSTDNNHSLFLNVWVPTNATADSKLPVEFWIYGGLDTAGSISDALYNGCNLATDAIVVSAAYRLGALGFFALESASIAGNMAVQDIDLALQWVQSNIASFGGDPVCDPTGPQIRNDC